MRTIFIVCRFLVFTFTIGAFIFFSFKKEEKKIFTTINSVFTHNLDDTSSGEQVALLQGLLKTDTTLYTGPISGFYSQGTKDAVVQFQKKYLISPTGLVDMATRVKLNEIFSQLKNRENIISKIKKDGKKWGVANKIEGTRYGWTMVIENDISMGTAQQISSELNIYRIAKGKGVLQVSQSLNNFAEMRAMSLNENGGVDEHRGFKEYIRNSDNRSMLGYTRYGENTSCGYRMTAPHLIKWIFAGDEPHDINQLNKQWTHVGVGVSGTCVSLVFAR